MSSVLAGDPPRQLYDGPIHAPRTIETTVHIQGLTKAYAPRRTLLDTVRRPFDATRTTVVRGVSFDVGRGEFFGLLGPNGAGKSTLFRMLATLVAPDAGTATVAGRDVRTQAAEVRRAVAIVSADERSLNWRLSAAENLRLFASLYGLDRRGGDRRIAELLATVGLADVGLKMAGAFSTGMRQRLLLARALLPTPRVLLLDEPTRGLDPLSAREFRTFLRRKIAGEQGCTVLLATHNAEEAFGLCDRVGVLHHGRLLAVGPADALARQWAEPRYRLHLDRPDAPIVADLEARGTFTRRGSPDRDDDGWWWVECELHGGQSAVADVLATLTQYGVRVAGCERLGIALADLIGRIVEAAAEGGDAT